MSLSRIYQVIILLCGAVAINSAPASAQLRTPSNTSASSQSAAIVRSRPRMKVIEVAPTRKQLKNFYTVVGAVKRSGVFFSPQKSIELKKLLDVAGGLKGADKSSIRIVRNGQSGLQLYYIAEQQYSHEIQAGDIVVVVPAADQALMTSVDGPYIPVACVGLSDRPIVIPLAADIHSVSRLLSELGQSLELRSSLRTLDPLGDSQSGRLIPGTILFFDVSKVDYAALATTSELPSALPLEMQIKSEGEGPEIERNEQQPQLGELPLIRNSASTLANDRRSMKELLLSQGLGSSVQGSQPRTADEPPQLLMNPQESVITVEDPNRVANHSESSASLTTPGFLLEGSTEGVPPVEAMPSIDLLPEEDIVNHDKAQVSVEEEATSVAEMAPPPPLTSRTLRAFAEDSPKLKSRQVPSQGKEIDQSPSEFVGLAVKNAESNSSLQSTSQLLFIVFGLGGIAVTCLTLSILWSRKERHKLRSENEMEVAVSTAENARRSQYIEEMDSDLQQVLSSEIPIIEEAVLLPTEISLHGRPVGQRRIIFHGKAEELKGHHFRARRKQASESTVAQQTVVHGPRESKRVARVYAGQPDSKQSSITNGKSIVEDVVQPPNICELQEIVSPAASSEAPSIHSSNAQRCEEQTFDVVVPIDHDIEGSGPLERALRVLAQERKV